MGNSNTHDSSWPGLRGSHHLPPYSIFYASPWGPHPNGFLSRDSQVGVLNSQVGAPKFQQLGLLQLWGRINSCADLWLQWVLKQSCSPCWELFNVISHITCTQGNRINSWLLVVGSQIANLTFGLFLGHNLCVKCPNQQSKPISDIYNSIYFQWYKELFKAMGFDPCNHALKIQESFWDLNSQHGSSLGSVRVHALTFFAFPGACEVTPASPSWPATL
jgi:hypothetical protein